MMNVRDETPLLTADYAHPNIVRNMVKFGVNVHVINDMGQSPLHLAVLAESEENVALLLDAGVDTSLVGIHDESALCVAVEMNLMKIAILLLDGGADVNQKFEQSRSVLCVAARTRNIPMVRLLLEYGANVSQINPSDGTSPLHFAVWLDDPSIARSMIEQGANINQQDNDGFAVFHEAVYEGNLRQVELLIEFKADIHVRTNEGETPLHFAALCNIPDSPDIVKYLLEQGANANEPNIQGTTPLHYAAMHCSSLLVFEICLDFGGDLKLRDEKNDTVLHFAAQNKNTDVLRFIVEKELFNVDERNSAGFTPLHYAVQAGNIKACDHLLNKGADINTRSNQGYSPLFLATKIQHLEVIKFLLKRGAGMAESVMDAVVMRGYQQINIVLVKHLAKLACLGIEMTPNDFQHLQGDEELAICFKVFKSELDRMKKAKIYEDISMFDIFANSINVIEGYARNEELVEAFEQNDDFWMFPNYGGDTKERFVEGMQKQKIRHDATIVLSNVLPFHPSHIAMEKIASYLGIDDLKFLATGIGNVKDNGEKEEDSPER